MNLEAETKRLDTIGWFLANLHQIIGHRQAAAFLGQPVDDGDMAICVLCRYERGETTRDEVIDRIGIER